MDFVSGRVNADCAMKQPLVDVKSVVGRFGGRAQLWRSLTAAGIEISPRTIDNWVDRGQIPIDRFTELVLLARLQGWKLIINDYLNPLNK
jgi:hypothetical protein